MISDIILKETAKRLTSNNAKFNFLKDVSNYTFSISAFLVFDTFLKQKMKYSSTNYLGKWIDLTKDINNLFLNRDLEIKSKNSP